MTPDATPTIVAAALERARAEGFELSCEAGVGTLLAEALLPTDRHRELLAAIEREFLRRDPPSELRIRAAG